MLFCFCVLFRAVFFCLFVCLRWFYFLIDNLYQFIIFHQDLISTENTYAAYLFQQPRADVSSFSGDFQSCQPRQVRALSDINHLIELYRMYSPLVIV